MASTLASELLQYRPYKDTDTKTPPSRNTTIQLPPSPAQSEYNHAEFDPSETKLQYRSFSNTSIALGTVSDILFPLPPPTTPPTEILQQDKNTPDHHVPRDPRLIRLTGIHPFNVEAPLSALYDEGFLTSADLFYVRNHGGVPKVEDSEIPDWTFSIEGLVENPIKMTLRDLIRDYEQITTPITLVCAGNRRKEQNQVRKSKGFSWGAAGVSTALWTGVPIGELLRRAKPKRGAKYVCMEGADKLPNGYYGTNVKLNWAMDPNRGIMLAHKMNGEMLRPDHGKPLRVVVPGQIGGRSVKWLKKLIVTESYSDNWYHIYDNRVLPTMISPEQSASEPKWWTDERYAIYDLSTNSATVYPAHDEKLYLSSPDQDTISDAPETEATYSVKGYAYGGGGRRVTRVEVTLDKGKSWLLANITYPEDAYREHADENQELCGGRLDMAWRETSFCWCFWDLALPISRLADPNVKDIMVRAMDESMNVQPRDMYWSVLGMMNNPWFRITITKGDGKDGKGEHLRFEHPTQPALMPGGWMERVKAAGGNLANGFWGEKLGGSDAADEVIEEEVKEIKMTKEGLNRAITIDELRKHDTDSEPWFVVNGEVYDGTAFLEGHPGGATSITGAAGQDATDEFMAIHSETAKAMMSTYHIGSLDEASRIVLATPSPSTLDLAALSGPSPIFLKSKIWTKALLHSKTVLSSDTRVFRFSLEHDEQTIGLPIGQHLMMRLRDPVTRDAIIRSYTPISEGTDKAVLDILIKVYFDTKDRPGGKMTKALDSIPVGHYVDFKGPIGKFEYLGRGRCTIGGKERFVKRFIMICGGSGITPIFQVLRAVLKDKEDPTRCIVLDGNRAEEDILLEKEMDGLCEGVLEGKVKIIHTLSRPTDAWTGLKGRVGRELLEREVGNYGADGVETPNLADAVGVKEIKKEVYKEGEQLVLICGPETLEKSVHGILNKMGWGDRELLFF